jgi:hypothetical protein
MVMNVVKRIQRLVSNGHGKRGDTAASFIQRRSGALGHLDRGDIDDITNEAMKDADQAVISEDARVHREQLKARSGQRVRSQQEP